MIIVREKVSAAIFPPDSVLHFLLRLSINLKKDLKKDECMIQVDYSESSHNKNQDEIQSACFGHQTFNVLQHSAI